MLTNPDTAVARCQSTNQSWTAALAQYQEEIDQLLSQLTDLCTGFTYRSLHHSPEQYHRDLSGLRNRIERLRSECLCDHLTCRPAQSFQCLNARFGLYETVSWTALTDEFTHLQTGCRQLFANLLSLNLL